MSKLSTALAVVCITLTVPLAHAQDKAPKTEEDKTLYALGLSVGMSLAPFTLSPAELELVLQGLRDAVQQKKPAVELKTYEPKVQELYRKRRDALSTKEKEKGKGFVEKAAKEKGAQKLPNGAILIATQEGKGATPAATDTVKVHYKGTLTDGTEFDSSYARNEPATFPLNGVIPCWTEGLQRLKVGGKARLVCPSDVAYGDQGRQPRIPGGATLLFEVELLDIVKDAPKPAHPGGAPKK